MSQQISYNEATMQHDGKMSGRSCVLSVYTDFSAPSKHTDSKLL